MAARTITATTTSTPQPATTTRPPSSSSGPNPSITAPDAHTLTSWQEAFATHPLPGIRRLETQLRGRITEQGARLRGLVGAHYRDLLGTADRIVAMHAACGRAEAVLRQAGRACNAGVLERGAQNLSRVGQELRPGRQEGDVEDEEEGEEEDEEEEEEGEKEAEEGGKRGGGGGGGRLRRQRQRQQRGGWEMERQKERTLVAGRLLRAAITGVRRMVRRDGDALLAAKTLVFGRMLFKVMADDGGEMVGKEELRSGLGAARRKLLAYVARMLGTVELKREEAVRVLCAYALITSSAPRDVLRFFLHVRLQQIEAMAASPREEDLSQLLELYRRTLLDTREIFPRRFADGLAMLSTTALVQDAQMRSATELSLDVYEHWIAEDVRNFTPWFGHDQLTPSEIREALMSWTKLAQGYVLQGLADALEDVVDVEVVLRIRQQILSRYLSLSTRIKDQSHSQAFNQMRETFLARLKKLAARAATIGAVPWDLPSVNVKRSMWATATEKLDLENGALKFRQTILQRQYGGDASTQRVTAVLEEWSSRLGAFQRHIGSMRAMKWDDDIDYDLDELDDGDMVQTTLSKSDPQQLTGELQEATVETLRRTYAEVASRLTAGADATFLIRVVREVDDRRRKLYDILEETESVKPEQMLIRSLHQQVTNSVIKSPVEQYVERLHVRTPTAVTLWDGTPPVPMHPSPVTYRFLSALHRSMSDAGNDLWSVGAVRALQTVLDVQLKEALSELPESKEFDPANGTSDEATADDAEEEAKSEASKGLDAQRDFSLQRLFDVLYLQRVLTSGDAKESGKSLGEVADMLTERLKLEHSTVERVRKNAHDYWRKTHLLFALLSPAMRS